MRQSSFLTTPAVGTRARPAAAIAVPIQLSSILVITVHRDPGGVSEPRLFE